MRAPALLVVCLLLLQACSVNSSRDSGSSGGGGGSAGGGFGGGGGGSAGGSAGGVQGDAGLELDLLPKLAGLWTGPATMTPLGNFPQMTFDLRPVDSQFVFGQTELDATDTLRFGFSVETYGGRDVLAYRNGGYFQGVLRDSRTQLVERDGGTWRFCSVTDAGCGYIDARFSLAQDSLVLDTKVRGAQHVYWNAHRVEARLVPVGFPLDTSSRGDGTAPWPAMASVQVNASFGVTPAAPVDVWLLMTTTSCLPTFQCHASRSVMLSLDGGVSQATLTLPSVHAGAYKATVVLDLDRNFASTLAPSHGDRLAVDQDLTVSDGGVATLGLTTSFVVP